MARGVIAGLAHPPSRAPLTRAQRQRLDNGLLNAEQRVSWHGAPIPPEQFPRVLDGLRSAHFAAVQRASLGLVRPHWHGAEVQCSFGIAPRLLVFTEMDGEHTPTGATRCFRIDGGWLARRATGFGALTLGVASVPEPTGDARVTLWSRVDGFPSRFLTPIAAPGVRAVWPLVGRIYAAYHASVTFWYLTRYARELQVGAHDRTVPS